jgi:hypothetical protein
MKSFLAAVLAGVVALTMTSVANATATNEVTLASLGMGSVTTSKPTTKVRYNKNFRSKKTVHTASTGSHSAGARPGKWCGWWMRTQFGGGPEYNVARNWARRGVSTTPQVGAIVVWPHHVGYISGRASNGTWIVKSGNDGGRVRERARSLNGAIAFRSLNGSTQVAGL